MFLKRSIFLGISLILMVAFVSCKDPKVEEITVILDANGGTIDGEATKTLKFQKGESLDASKIPATPEKSGYVFEAWYLNDEKVIFPIDLNEAITLKAKWKLNSYTVNFDGNGANSGKMEAQTFTFNVEQELSANTFKKDNYIFAGWALKKDGAVEYTDKKKLKDIPLDGKTSVTLFAVWTASRYTVNFDGNGANSGKMEAQTFTYNVEQELNANTFEKKNYEFAGWSLKKDATVEYTDKKKIKNLPVGEDSSVTLYAVWRGAKYTVKFDGNGGTGTMKEQTLTYDVEEALTANTFKKTGCQLDGWSLTKGEAVEYADKAKVKNITADVNSPVTLYAVWGVAKYKVKFDGNGASSGTMEAQNFTYDIEQALTANTFARKGYTHAGWALKKSATTATYTNSQSVKNLPYDDNFSVTLFAIWTPNTYKVHFDANGGTGTMADQTFTYDKAQALTANAFSKTNCVFKEWKFDASTYKNQALVKNLADGADATVTLVAQWDVSPEQVIETAKNNLKLKFSSGDTAEKVTKTINLLSKIKDIDSITWSSNNTSILSIKSSNTPYGVSTYTKINSRPELTTAITLTATLKKATLTRTKDFTIKIYGSDNEAVDNAYDKTNVGLSVVLFGATESTKTMALTKDASVTTTWTSSDTAIIPNADNTATSVTVTAPTAKTDVTFTATIAKGSFSRDKVFTITVFEQGGNASETDLLKLINLASEASAYFDLADAVSGSTEAIIWTSADSKIIEVANGAYGFTGQFAKIKPLIFEDQNVNLTATIGSASKNFTITVKGVKSCSYKNKSGSTMDVAFESNKIITDYGEFKYKDHDKINKSFTREIVALKNDNGDWVNDIEDYVRDDWTAEFDTDKIMVKAFKELVKKSTITLQDLNKEYVSPICKSWEYSLPTTDEEIFHYLHDSVRPFNKLIDIGFNDFKALSSGEQTEKIKEGIEKERVLFVRNFGLDKGSTWDEIDVQEECEKLINFHINKLKINFSYTYDFKFSDNGSKVEFFESKAVYKLANSWYNQSGKYLTTSSGDEVHISYSYYKHAEFKINSKSYWLNFDDTFTNFNGKIYGGSETIEGSITKDSGGNLTVSIDGRPDYELLFKGYGVAEF